MEDTVEEIASLCEKINTFTSLCHLFIYCSIIHRRYFGTSDYNRL